MTHRNKPVESGDRRQVTPEQVIADRSAYLSETQLTSNLKVLGELYSDVEGALECSSSPPTDKQVKVLKAMKNHICTRIKRVEKRMLEQAPLADHITYHYRHYLYVASHATDLDYLHILHKEVGIAMSQLFFCPGSERVAALRTILNTILRRKRKLGPRRLPSLVRYKTWADDEEECDEEENDE